MPADGNPKDFQPIRLYKHKAVGGSGTGLAMLRAAGIDDAISTVPAFLKAIAQHRDWTREERAQRIPV